MALASESPLTSGQCGLLRLALPILIVLSENPDVPMADVIQFERTLSTDDRDATVRHAYADWLIERGCPIRAAQVHHDLDVIATGKLAPVWRIREFSQTPNVFGDDQVKVTFSRYLPLTPPHHG